MTVFFLAVIGAIAITALLVYDMDRKRRRMREVLARLEPLAEGSKKFRAQYLRGISRSIFFNDQLMDAMDREIGVMEAEREIPSPEESGERSLFSIKRLKALEARLETLEMFKLAQQSGDEVGGGSHRRRQISQTGRSTTAAASHSKEVPLHRPQPRIDLRSASNLK